jgi:hypothetical protein
MISFIRFALPFIMGLSVGFVTMPELRALSDANYEQKINNLVTQVNQCQQTTKAIKGLLK